MDTKNIFITGASSGIGRQLVIDYAKAGHMVYASARRETELNKLKKEFPEQIIAVVTDVASKNSVAKAIDSLPSIDLAILNAGTCEYVDVDKFESEMFERIYQVNFMGVVYCTEHLISKMKKGGQLAIVGSLSRQLPFTRAQAYGSSKAAIHYYTKSLAVDAEEKWGISIHSISPGFVKTPLTDKNDFPMPFLISVEEASRSIIHGLSKNKADISFPKNLSWTLLFLSLLPESWQHKVCLKMKNEPQK